MNENVEEDDSDSDDTGSNSTEFRDCLLLDILEVLRDDGFMSGHSIR